jgi:hypothetical protein
VALPILATRISVAIIIRKPLLFYNDINDIKGGVLRTYHAVGKGHAPGERVERIPVTLAGLCGFS